MQNRIILSLLIVFLLLAVCACSSSRTESAAEIQHETKATKPLEKFDSAVGRNNNNDSAAQKSDVNDMEDLEMKHWKYNRDLQAAREAGQQISKSQSDAVPAGQNSSDINDNNSMVQKNYLSGTGDYKPAKISFITEDDIKKFAGILIELGYLNVSNSNDEQSFKKALSLFQADQGLQSSGQLDAETIKHLDAKTNR